ncbi:MAG: T9SS type A sorting domain-containing protein [Bacteroidales bacterium]|nr:T9SS type A sorting domain-containing protein [Bacteroidales bacterium]
MKIYFLLLTLLFTGTQIYSQHSFEYFHHDKKYPVHFVETNDNKLAFFMDDSLFVFSQEGEILETIKIHEENKTIGTILKDENGEYTSVGLYDYVEESHFNFWFKKYDSNLNTLWENTYYVDIEDRGAAWTWDCIKNFDNEILILLNIDSASIFSPDSTFIYQFTETGDFIGYHKFEDYQALRNGKLIQIPDTSGYLFANHNTAALGGSTDCIFKLDNNFNIDTVYNTFLSGNIDYERYPNLKFITDTSFIFTGDGSDYQAGFSDIVGITLYDTAFNEIKRQIFGFEDVWNHIAEFKGLSFVDTSSVYISYTTPGLHYYPPSELNYSVVVKLNSSLDVQWEKFYGDSSTMSMLVKNIYATNDGGCIITGDIQFTPFGEPKVKTYIVKLDAEGNLPVSINGPKIKAHELILYPNPGNEHLNIRTAVQRLGGEFTMYDITGKLVFQQKITERLTEINTGDLPTGTYIYNYTHKGNEIESGKWVKQ